MLRANGATRARRCARMVLVESSLLGLTGSLLGCGAGVVLAVLLDAGDQQEVLRWTVRFQLEPGVMVQAVALMVVVSALAGCSQRSCRRPRRGRIDAGGNGMRRAIALVMACGRCSRAAWRWRRPRRPPPRPRRSPPEGFRLAVPPYVFSFPRDHASHPAFKTEWWYYTGHPERAGKSNGYELTFFRVGLPRDCARGASPRGPRAT